MNRNDLISVVVAVYNGEKYLRAQLESVARQTYRNMEVIIIDDDSKDSSFLIAQQAAKTDGRIKAYRNQKNLGLVPNFLKGASLAKGEFVCFCDQDDLWRLDKLTVLVNLLQQSAKNMLAYSDLEICDEGLQRTYESFWQASSIKPKKGYLCEKVFLKNITPGCSMMFKKSVSTILAAVPPDAPFMHDHLVLVISACLGRIVYTNEKLVQYRQHGSNNIGAFYNSTVNNEKIIEELHKKVVFFKKILVPEPGLDVQKLLSFCDTLRKGNILQRVFFMEYYLFLRNDTLLDKALGVLECLFPKMYTWLKEKGEKKEIYVWTQRLFFIVWSVVVLSAFTRCFILYKFSNFLTWVK